MIDWKVSKCTYVMRPSVNADFVSRHVFFTEDVWSRNDTGANDEEGRGNVLLVQELEEFTVITVRGRIVVSDRYKLTELEKA
jgi:hypothetical protein